MPNSNSNGPLNFARSSCGKSMLKILPLTPGHGLALRPQSAVVARPDRLEQKIAALIGYRNIETGVRSL
jgi:hypothetical protein